MDNNEAVVRGALSCVRRILVGSDLTIDADGHEGWCWITEHLQVDELQRQLDAGEQIDTLPSTTEVVPCTEDELRAMQYVSENSGAAAGPATGEPKDAER